MNPPKNITVAGIIIALALIGGAVSLTTRGGTAQEVTAGAQQTPQAKMLAPREFSLMLAAKDFSLVNVHTPYEGAIAGTDAFIPYDTIGNILGELPQDKNAKIVLYCKSGRMSAVAAQTLISRGYTNVYDLQGGMDAWEQNGYQIIKK